MKRRSIFVVVVAIVLLGCVIFLDSYKINNEEQRIPVQIAIDNGELLVSSREGYNYVTIYKKENSLVIYAESDTVYFDGAQFIVETQGKVEPEDIEVIWTTLGGGTERTEDNDLIIAEIKISEDNNLIFDTKVNFAQKGFEILDELFKRQMK